MRFLNDVLLVARKDLRTELRTGALAPVTILFALGILVLFTFLLPQGSAILVRIAPAVLWASLAFGALLGLGQSFAGEREHQAVTALLASPVDPAALYLGKTAGILTLLAATLAVLLPASVVLYRTPDLDPLLRSLPILALGLVGLAAVGTLFSAATLHLRGGGFGLPILVLPLALPLLLASVKATGIVWAGQPLAAAADWFRILVVYNLVFVTASSLLFEILLRKE